MPPRPRTLSASSRRLKPGSSPPDTSSTNSRSGYQLAIQIFPFRPPISRAPLKSTPWSGNPRLLVDWTAGNAGAGPNRCANLSESAGGSGSQVGERQRAAECVRDPHAFRRRSGKLVVRDPLGRTSLIFQYVPNSHCQFSYMSLTSASGGSPRRRVSTRAVSSRVFPASSLANAKSRESGRATNSAPGLRVAIQLTPAGSSCAA